jgi:hypothetical protein
MEITPDLLLETLIFSLDYKIASKVQGDLDLPLIQVVLQLKE